jgi:hypothetical protein
VATPHVARGNAGPWQAGLLPVDARTTVLGWLKAAEDGDDVILRLLEVAGGPDAILLPGTDARHPIAPHSIATLRGTPRDGWWPSDGLEG